jgi:hypothetical protein
MPQARIPPTSPADASLTRPVLRAQDDAPPEISAMIRVRTLGQCSIQIDTMHVGPDAEMVFASLLLLTVERGRRVGRSELLGMLWPDAPASRASHCLRQTTYRLRTLGTPLEVTRTHLTLPSSVVDSDVDALLRASRTDDIEHLADRVSGPFLPGYSPTFSEPCGTGWSDNAISFLRERDAFWLARSAREGPAASGPTSSVSRIDASRSIH